MPDPISPVYTPRNTTTPRTRMGKRLAPLPKVYDPEPEATKAKIAIKKVAAKKPVNLVGRPPIDDQFAATVTFSPAYGEDAGRTYGAMLPLTPGAASPEGNKEFYVRCLVEQSRVDPLLQGFQLLWEAPPGWVAVDGIGGTTYDEAVSNPVQITRVYKSPSTIATEIGFRVRIRAKYKP